MYLGKPKGYTVINVLGLGVGNACCILIMLFVKSEWSFDRFHQKSDRIYRAWLKEHCQGEFFCGAAALVPLGPVLQAGLAEAETTCRVANLRPVVTYQKNSFNEAVAMADSTFFQLFDFPFTSEAKRQL